MKYMMVDTISQFRIRYVIEVPDDAECTPEQFAEDMVITGDVKEFSQKHLDEIIVSTREVTLEEALKQFKIDNDNYVWTPEVIIRNAITPSDFNYEEYMKEEQARYDSLIND